jgi:hypothetical protein
MRNKENWIQVNVLWKIRTGWIFALLCFGIALGTSTVLAFTSEDADTLFDAHKKAFYQEKDGLAWYKDSTEGIKKFPIGCALNSWRWFSTLANARGMRKNW